MVFIINSFGRWKSEPECFQDVLRIAAPSRLSKEEPWSQVFDTNRMTSFDRIAQTDAHFSYQHWYCVDCVNVGLNNLCIVGRFLRDAKILEAVDNPIPRKKKKLVKRKGFPKRVDTMSARPGKQGPSSNQFYTTCSFLWSFFFSALYTCSRFSETTISNSGDFKQLKLISKTIQLDSNTLQ